LLVLLFPFVNPVEFVLNNAYPGNQYEACCSGVVWTGEPKGTKTKLNDLDVYVAHGPSGDKSRAGM
jgi:hypothetical protein